MSVEVLRSDEGERSYRTERDNNGSHDQDQVKSGDGRGVASAGKSGLARISSLRPSRCVRAQRRRVQFGRSPGWLDRYQSR